MTKRLKRGTWQYVQRQLKEQGIERTVRTIQLWYSGQVMAAETIDESEQLKEKVRKMVIEFQKIRPKKRRVRGKVSR